MHCGNDFGIISGQISENASRHNCGSISRQAAFWKCFWNAFQKYFWKRFQNRLWKYFKKGCILEMFLEMFPETFLETFPESFLEYFQKGCIMEMFLEMFPETFLETFPETFLETFPERGHYGNLFGNDSGKIPETILEIIDLEGIGGQNSYNE